MWPPNDHTTHRKGGPGEGDQLDKGIHEFVKALAHPSRSKKGEDVGKRDIKDLVLGLNFAIVLRAATSWM